MKCQTSCYKDQKKPHRIETASRFIPSVETLNETLRGDKRRTVFELTKNDRVAVVFVSEINGFTLKNCLHMQMPFKLGIFKIPS